jgi:hypothetical protein
MHNFKIGLNSAEPNKIFFQLTIDNKHFNIEKFIQSTIRYAEQYKSGNFVTYLLKHFMLSNSESGLS